MAVILCLTAFLLRHRMGIIEADQAFTIRPMQRERIIDAMWFLRQYRNPRHHEADPVAALRVHYENLRVEIEKHIESGSAWLRYDIGLSD